MKTAEEALFDELSDHHIEHLKAYPFLIPWILDGMKEYTKQVAQNSLNHAYERALITYVPDPNNFGKYLKVVDKESIVLTPIITP